MDKKIISPIKMLEVPHKMKYKRNWAPLGKASQ